MVQSDVCQIKYPEHIQKTGPNEGRFFIKLFPTYAIRNTAITNTDDIMRASVSNELMTTGVVILETVGVGFIYK